MENTQNQEIISTKKSHLPKNKRLFWVFFVFSAITLALGVALLPIWNGTNVFWESWGYDFFSLILFFIIFVYIVGFLLKQIIREKKIAVKILTVFEAGFFFAIAIGCIMEQFDLVSVVGPCTIVGAALWSRGFVYIVKAYLCKHDESDKYPLWMLIVSVGLVTLGTIMMANDDVFTTNHIVWAVSCVLILVAVIFLALGFISKPKVDKTIKRLKKQQKKQRQEEKALARQQKKTLKSRKKTEKLEHQLNENAIAALPAPSTSNEGGGEDAGDNNQ